MAHDVFVSYSSKDEHAGNAACDILERHGIRCWVAHRDAVPGVDWATSIIEAIDQSRAMVLIFTRNANVSRQVQREINHADTIQIPIINFRVEDLRLSPALQFYLSTTHWLDASTPPIDDHLVRLAETVEVLLAPRMTSPLDEGASSTLPIRPHRENAEPERDRIDAAADVEKAVDDLAVVAPRQPDSGAELLALDDGSMPPDERMVPSSPLSDAKSDDFVYLYGHASDVELCSDVAIEFKKAGIECKLNAFEGSDNERVALHRQYLREASAVVFVWGMAKEAWAMVMAEELKDWKSLGRYSSFSSRAVLTMPPSSLEKMMFVNHVSGDSFDVTFDHTGRPGPITLEVLEILAPAGSSNLQSTTASGSISTS
jgi:hypothetical protein